jgi:hypothetical protein
MMELGGTNPETMSVAWGVAPVALAWPGRTAGLSAVVFSGRAASELELSSPSDPTTHVLAVATRGHRASLAIDGREVHRGFFEAGAVQLIQAGEKPAAVLTGDWRVIHIYLPAGDLADLAEDIGLSAVDARGLAFFMPCFAQEPMLGRIGRRLDQRLARGDAPSRLELDELFLAIGCRLIRMHATAKAPRRWRPSSLSAQERRRLTEVLSEADDPGFDDLSRELDRCGAEAERAFRQTFRVSPHHMRSWLKRSRT